jgi:hypothetical protein
MLLKKALSQFTFVIIGFAITLFVSVSIFNTRSTPANAAVLSQNKIAITNCINSCNYTSLDSVDFTNDRISDDVVYNSSTGYGIQDGRTNIVTNIINPTTSTALRNYGWEIQGVGDFNGDAQSDLWFVNIRTGQTAVWYMNGLQIIKQVATPTVAPITNWDILSVKDLDTDGINDILWRSKVDGTLVIWYGKRDSGFSVVVFPYKLTSDWSLQFVGQLDGATFSSRKNQLLFTNNNSKVRVNWEIDRVNNGLTTNSGIYMGN